ERCWRRRLFRRQCGACNVSSPWHAVGWTSGCASGIRRSWRTSLGSRGRKSCIGCR
ncbi:unnamed protein product, partial [Prorocentrum cordatum]